jgi:hypothetical protein
MAKLKRIDLIRQPGRCAAALREARPAQGWTVGMTAWGQKQSFGDTLAKVRFGMKSGSRHKSGLPDW